MKCHIKQSRNKWAKSDEIEYGSVEDPVITRRIPSNEIDLVLEIPYITNDRNVIITPGQGNK